MFRLTAETLLLELSGCPVSFETDIENNEHNIEANRLSLCLVEFVFQHVRCTRMKAWLAVCVLSTMPG